MSNQEKQPDKENYQKNSCKEEGQKEKVLKKEIFNFSDKKVQKLAKQKIEGDRRTQEYFKKINEKPQTTSLAKSQNNHLPQTVNEKKHLLPPDQIKKAHTLLLGDKAKYSPMVCTKRTFRGITTVNKAMNTDLPTLGRLKQMVGEEIVEDYIIQWIIDLQDFYNVQRNINERQALQTVALIMSEDYFVSLKISDIYLIFHRIKKGDFGKVYDRLDGEFIMNAFQKYCDERSVIAATMSRTQHEAIMSGTRRDIASNDEKPVHTTYYDGFIDQLAKDNEDARNRKKRYEAPKPISDFDLKK